MKLVRISLAILSLLVIVAIVAIGSLILLVDPNKLKPTIVSQVQKQTGYRLQIDGNLTWSFYPRLGVKIQRMTVGLPEKSLPFADLQDIRIATQLSALIRNEALASSIYIAETRIGKLHLQNTQLKIQWQNNILSLSPITASLYGGSLTGVAHGSQLSTIPVWDWSIELNRLQIQSLLDDLNRDNKVKLSGIGNITLRNNTLGKSQDQLLENLTGNVTFNVENGSLQGIDLNYFIQSADALLNKQSPTNIPKMKQTPFNQMSGSAVIKDGIATSNDLLVSSSSFTTKGSGTINLIDQTLDYQLQVMPLQTIKIKGAIPIQLTGSLQNPLVQLDMLKLNTMIAQDQLEKIKTKIQKEVKQLPGKIDKFLQRFMDN
ncbi:MAG: hypothetical protein A3F11_00125 [Gammaproteobacteria bacterium RIFCSPHIGHO2_12_FULL_37_14]|nr:MAG: hypothetical protein A3F11_00125 [Gammaproteobacteria bacterium RIFCSPHIGHO2_12_FULL_37_14]